MICHLQLFAFIIAIALSGPVFGTCIVIHRTSRKIFVGADSRRVMDEIHQGGQGTRQVLGPDGCKIKHAGRCHFALAGFADEQQIKVAERACRKGRNLAEVAEIFKVESTKKALELTKYYNDMDPASYHARFNGDPGLNDVSFFGFEKGEATIVTLHSKLDNQANYKADVSFAQFNNSEVSLLGLRANIIALPKQDVYANLRAKPLETIKLLIELEANYTPFAVGPPIDLLELRATGPVWHAKKPQCP